MVSILINIILFAVLFSVGQQLFSLKSLVETQLLGGLYQNFVAMDKAHIRTTIPINAQVPAKFDLPLKTKTTVTLTEDTHLDHATIYELNAGALFISEAKTNIVLPAGTTLPVELDLTRTRRSKNSCQPECQCRYPARSNGFTRALCRFARSDQTILYFTKQFTQLLAGSDLWNTAFRRLPEAGALILYEVND